MAWRIGCIHRFVTKGSKMDQLFGNKNQIPRFQRQVILNPAFFQNFLHVDRCKPHLDSPRLERGASPGIFFLSAKSVNPPARRMALLRVENLVAGNFLRARGP